MISKVQKSILESQRQIFSVIFSVLSVSISFVLKFQCNFIDFHGFSVLFKFSVWFSVLKFHSVCNRRIDQSADNVTGLKCAKEIFILKYKVYPESLAQSAHRQIHIMYNELMTSCVYNNFIGLWYHMGYLFRNGFVCIVRRCFQTV